MQLETRQIEPVPMQDVTAPDAFSFYIQDRFLGPLTYEEIIPFTNTKELIMVLSGSTYDVSLKEQENYATKRNNLGWSFRKGELSAQQILDELAVSLALAGTGIVPDDRRFHRAGVLAIIDTMTTLGSNDDVISLINMLNSDNLEVGVYDLKFLYYRAFATEEPGIYMALLNLFDRHPNLLYNIPLRMLEFLSIVRMNNADNSIGRLGYLEHLLRKWDLAIMLGCDPLPLESLPVADEKSVEEPVEQIQKYRSLVPVSRPPFLPAIFCTDDIAPEGCVPMTVAVVEGLFNRSIYDLNPFCGEARPSLPFSPTDIVFLPKDFWSIYASSFNGRKLRGGIEVTPSFDRNDPSVVILEGTKDGGISLRVRAIDMLSSLGYPRLQIPQIIKRMGEKLILKRMEGVPLEQKVFDPHYNYLARLCHALTFIGFIRALNQRIGVSYSDFKGDSIWVGCSESGETTFQMVDPGMITKVARTEDDRNFFMIKMIRKQSSAKETGLLILLNILGFDLRNSILPEIAKEVCTEKINRISLYFLKDNPWKELVYKILGSCDVRELSEVSFDRIYSIILQEAKAQLTTYQATTRVEKLAYRTLKGTLMGEERFWSSQR